MILKTTHLNCHYSAGALRYIALGDEELVRMVYCTALATAKMASSFSVISRAICAGFIQSIIS